MASDTDEKYIAAVDIGTTSLRCYIFNSKAEIIGRASTQVNLNFIHFYKIKSSV